MHQRRSSPTQRGRAVAPVLPNAVLDSIRVRGPFPKSGRFRSSRESYARSGDVETTSRHRARVPRKLGVGDRVPGAPRRSRAEGADYSPQPHRAFCRRSCRFQASVHVRYLERSIAVSPHLKTCAARPSQEIGEYPEWLHENVAVSNSPNGQWHRIAICPSVASFCQWTDTVCHRIFATL